MADHITPMQRLARPLFDEALAVARDRMPGRDIDEVLAAATINTLKAVLLCVFDDIDAHHSRETLMCFGGSLAMGCAETMGWALAMVPPSAFPALMPEVAKHFNETAPPELSTLLSTSPATEANTEKETLQ